MDRDKLKKVAILAMDGEPGEKEAAARILEKHGITIDELLTDMPEKVWVEFKYKTAFERTLIAQTYFKLMNVNSMEYCKSGQNRIEIEVPTSQGAHFIKSVQTVLKLWRKELKRFQEAFIQGNRLFSNLPSMAKPTTEMTDEEILEIEELLEMAAQIKTANIDHKMLGSGPATED